MTSVLLLSLLAAAPQAAELSYAQALEVALERNPTLVQAQASLSSAHGSLVSAKGSFDPSWTLGANTGNTKREGYSQLGLVYSNTHSTGYNTGLSQYLPTGTSYSLDWSVDSSTYLYELIESGMTWEELEPQRYSTLSASVSQSLLQGHRMAYNLANVREAQRSVDRAEASLMATRLQAVADTASAYWNLVYMHDLEDIARQAVAVAEEEGRVVRAMVEAGQLAPVEATRVQAAVVTARSTLIEAEHAHRTAGETLAQLMGADPAEVLQPSSQPEQPMALSLDDAQVVAAALEGNPELLVYRSTVESARISLANAKHGRLPELAVTASAGLYGYDEDFSAALSEMASGEYPYWSLGADLSVPLGNRADRGSLMAAEASLTEAQQSLEAMERSVAAQVLAQIRSVEAGQVKVELAQANLDLAEQTLAAEKAKQREGRAIQKDVLEALRSFSDAQAGLVQARTEYVLAMVELGRLKGRIEGVAS